MKGLWKWLISFVCWLRQITKCAYAFFKIMLQKTNPPKLTDCSHVQLPFSLLNPWITYSALSMLVFPKTTGGLSPFICWEWMCSKGKYHYQALTGKLDILLNLQDISLCDKQFSLSPLISRLVSVLALLDCVVSQYVFNVVVSSCFTDITPLILHVTFITLQIIYNLSLDV